MKRVVEWWTVPMIGTGDGRDPFRPDLSGVSGVLAWGVAARSATEALVCVLREVAA